MKISIQMISLDFHELFFLFDHQHRTVIEFKEIQYQTLGSLLKVLPQLLREKNLTKLAQIANFLSKGIEFQYIEDIENFKTSYYQQMEEASFSLLNEKPSMNDYGVFDLSTMHPPLAKDHQLIFFVKHDYLGIPYRVTLHYPTANDLDPEMHYELLPLLKKDNGFYGRNER